MKYLQLGRILLLVLSSIICSHNYAKMWTILVYISGDNDLKDFIDLNLTQMRAVGSNDTVNIVVYLCEKKNGIKAGKRIYILKNGYQVIAIDPQADGGSRQTFKNACLWAVQQYPADHYAVIVWDHGSGPLNRIVRGVAYDYTTGHYLTDRDLYSVLQDLHATLGKKLDILGFDACLMAGIELQGYCAPFVDYFVASQETIPGTGWDYRRFLSRIAPNSAPELVAKAMVDAYHDAYAARIKDFTLSVVALQSVDVLSKKINDLGLILVKLLSLKDMQKPLTRYLKMVALPSQCVCFDDPYYDYVDLENLLRNMIKQASTLTAAATSSLAQQLTRAAFTIMNDILQLRAQCVIAQTVGAPYAQAGGISIYWPRIKAHYSYDKLGWTALYPAWATLINHYAYYNRKVQDDCDWNRATCSENDCL